MSKNRKPSKRLPPLQLILMLLVFAFLVYVRIWSDQKEAAAPQPPTITAVQVKPSKAPQSQPGSSAPTIEFSPQLAPTLDTLPQVPAAQTTQVGIDSEPIDPRAFKEFDYFLLALSWSPDYCATSGGNDPQQCSIGRKLGFVLHGLWPQYNRGYPSNCSTEKMSDNVKAQFPGLYPSEKLYDHEWEKHGTCTGLSTTGYLALSGQLRAAVTIPDAYRSPEAPFRTTVSDLKQAFTQANPGFPEDGFAVNCSGSGRYLKELYVCFSLEGQPTTCSAEVLRNAARSCQSADFLVRNIR